MPRFGAGGGGASAHTDLTGVAVNQHQPSVFKRPLQNVAMYDLPGWAFAGNSFQAIVANRLYFIPIYIGDTRTLDRIGLRVSSAGAAGTVARMGIYEADLVSGSQNQIQPGDLILDAGTVAVDSTGNKEITISQEMTPGFYFLAFSSDGAPSLNGINSAQVISSPVTGLASSLASTASITIVWSNVADGAAALPDPAPALGGTEATEFACLKVRS